MRKALSILAAGLLLALAGALLMGHLLSAPVRHSVGAAPPDLHAVAVEFGGLKGWFVAADPAASRFALQDAPNNDSSKTACVLLMHGVRADRRSMIERARMLRRAGYASLLFDFQAHGESPGRRITFGYLEAANARAAVSVLRDRFQCSQVAAVGQSLGGAAALLGNGPIAVDALILESVYPSIDTAVANRLHIRLGALGARLAPVLTLQLKPLLGIDAAALQPVQHIADYRGPLLIIAGETDRHTTLAEARALYAAANQPKLLWVVAGAAHVDLQRFAPQAYERCVLAFLAGNLQTIR